MSILSSTQAGKAAVAESLGLEKIEKSGDILDAYLRATNYKKVQSEKDYAEFDTYQKVENNVLYELLIRDNVLSYLKIEDISNTLSESVKAENNLQRVKKRVKTYGDINNAVKSFIVKRYN